MTDKKPYGKTEAELEIECDKMKKKVKEGLKAWNSAYEPQRKDMTLVDLILLLSAIVGSSALFISIAWLLIMLFTSGGLT